VPQTGQVRASCCANPSSLAGSSRAPAGSGFMAQPVLRRQLEQYRSGSSLALLAPFLIQPFPIA
jgi:hypothetical protein